MKILCKIGIHKWQPTENNIFTETVCLFRTYLQCKKCGKWGKLVFFKDGLNEKSYLKASISNNKD